MNKIVHRKYMLGYRMDVTLWGEHHHVEWKELANCCSIVVNLILAIKGGHVAKFNAKSIEIISKNNILINLDIEESHKITIWFEKYAFMLHPHP